MADFDLELDGIQATAIAFREIEEKYAENEFTYLVGTGVEYGVYLEFGTEDMPPYPWFRPAIREYKANPESFIVDNTNYPSIDAIPSTDALVEAVAVSLQRRMEDNVNAQKASAERSPGVDPEHPRRDTGALTASIQAVRID